MISDLYLCRHMGWTLDDLLALDVDVYTVLVESVNAEAKRRA